MKELIKHPDFKDYNFDFDFAIIKIAYPMAFNQRQKAIALVENDSETPKSGEGVRVFGWGDTLNPLESTDYLRTVDLKVIDHEVCEQQYRGYGMQIKTNKICAAHPDGIDGKDACQVSFLVSQEKICSKTQLINLPLLQGDSGRIF